MIIPINETLHYADHTIHIIKVLRKLGVDFYFAKKLVKIQNCNRYIYEENKGFIEHIPKEKEILYYIKNYYEHYTIYTINATKLTEDNDKLIFNLFYLLK